MRPLLHRFSCRGLLHAPKSNRYSTRVLTATLGASHFVASHAPTPMKHTAKADVVSTSSAPALSVSVSQPALLGPVPEDAGLKTHHVKSASGKTTHFANPHPSFKAPVPLDIFWHLVLGKIFGFTSVPNPKGDEMEAVEPVFLPTRSPPASGGDLRATWLGHACQYVEFPSGLRVLFDPVLETYCAPLPHPWMRRFSAPAVTPDAVGRVLPFVDAVCISHSHYDHLSYPTVCALRDAFPRAHFFVGLGLRAWMVDTAGVAADRVTEMDWWEDAELTLTPTPSGKEEAEGEATAAPITARFSCLPAQHTSGRTGRDRDTTLWCSWGVASGRGGARRSLWFAGDTGYRAVPRQPASGLTTSAPDDHLPAAFPGGRLPPHTPQFAQVGALRGPFDLGLLPIGAYTPRHLFSGVHADPFDAVDMFADTRCRRAVAIHWGAWVLTPEEVLEPPQLLREALRRKGLPETGVFDVCKVGETVAV